MFLLAVLTGAGAGLLTAMTAVGAPQSLLCAAGAFGVAVGFFDRVIGPEHRDAVADPGHAEPVRRSSADR